MRALSLFLCGEYNTLSGRGGTLNEALCMYIVDLYLPHQCMYIVDLYLPHHCMYIVDLYLPHQCMYIVDLYLPHQCMYIVDLYLPHQCMYIGDLYCHTNKISCSLPGHFATKILNSQKQTQFFL